MARISTVQNNLSAGEVSPLLWDRYDLVQVENALKQLENMTLHIQGGASKRPGMRFVAVAKAAGARLYRFAFSSDDAAVLEFSNLAVRFFAQSGQIVSGSVPVEVVTPYTTADLADLRLVQEADTVFIFHPIHAPRRLVRLSATSWQLRPLQLEPPPSQEEGTTPSTSLTLTAITGNGITITAAAATFFNSDVDRILREEPAVGTGVAVITGFTSGTVVTANVISPFVSTSVASGTWRLSGSPVGELFVSRGAPIGARVRVEVRGTPATITNLLTNGNFASGLTGWTDLSGPTLATGTSDSGSDTSLVDAAVDFIAAGVEIGHRALNDTDVTEDRVEAVVDANTLTTATGGANWTGGGDDYTIRETGSAAVVAGRVNLSGGENGVAWIQQSVTLIAQHSYRLTFDVFNQPLSVQVGTTSGDSDLVSEQTFVVGNGHAVTFEAPGTTAFIQFRNNQNTSATLDNVVLSLFALDAWRTEDTGKFIRGNDGLIELTETGDTHHAFGVIRRSLSVDTPAPSGTWSLEETEWSAVKGWPHNASLFAGRLVVGGSNSFPDRVWMSRVGIYGDFGTGTSDDDAVELQLAASQVNLIEWVVGERLIAVGTRGEEFTIRGIVGEPITPTSFGVESPTALGSANLPALRVQRAVIHAQRGGTRLREIVFDESVGDRLSVDLNRLAPHITLSGIRSLAYAQLPEPTIWICTQDGQLVSLTYTRDDQIVGWARHPTTGTVLDVTVIPHPDGDRDQVWVLVDRGGTAPYVEFLDDNGDGHFTNLQVDSGLHATFGSPTTSITGLSHLEGQTVQPLGDGKPQPQKMVASGAITLDTAATVVEVGLPFLPLIRTLRPTLGDTSFLGLRGTVFSVYVSFLQSADATVNGQPVSFLQDDDLMDTAPPLRDLLQEVSSGGYDLEMEVLVSQTQPLPLTIRAIGRRIEVEDF